MPTRPRVRPKRRNEAAAIEKAHTPHALLSAMVAAVGVHETARRLARGPRIVQWYLQGRNRIPRTVASWLVAAAANSRAGHKDLATVLWHYPRAQPNRGNSTPSQQRARAARHRAELAADRARLPLPDPYA